MKKKKVKGVRADILANTMFTSMLVIRGAGVTKQGLKDMVSIRCVDYVLGDTHRWDFDQYIKTTLCGCVYENDVAHVFGTALGLSILSEALPEREISHPLLGEYAYPIFSADMANKTRGAALCATFCPLAKLRHRAAARFPHLRDHTAANKREVTFITDTDQLGGVFLYTGANIFDEMREPYFN